MANAFRGPLAPGYLFHRCIAPARINRPSNHALGKHRVGHFDEAGDVGAADVIDEVAVLAVLDAVLVDRAHDALQAGIDLFAPPVVELAVLGHFQPGNRHAAGVGRLARPVENLGVEEDIDALGLGGHVGPFRNADAAVLDQRAGVVGADFVLRRTGEGQFALERPTAACSGGIPPS